MRTWKCVVLKSATQSSAEDFSVRIIRQMNEHPVHYLVQAKLLYVHVQSIFFYCEIGWILINSASGCIE